MEEWQQPDERRASRCDLEAALSPASPGTRDATSLRMRIANASVLVLGFAFVSGGCARQEAAAAPAAVTCPAHVVHYPVAGAYNGGYDASWNDFRCDGSLNNSDYGGAHHGNDIFAARGTPIVSPVDGIVTRSGTASATSGLRVTVVDGCGWGYYHGHLDSIAGGIVVGAHVHAGQPIGTLGDTGTTGTAPHLHFNVHRDGNYDDDTDPFPLLQPVRGTACGVDPHCAGRADGSFCADGTHLASCTGGRFESGDCGAFGTTCDAPGGHARCTPLLDGVFVRSDFPGGTRIEVPIGHEVHGCLTYRNTGSWTWAPGTTNLGTSEPRDRVSALAGSDWRSPTRLATISASTATGATGRFCFSLRGARTTGTRVEHFSLVHDGFFWAADTGGVADTTNFLTVVTVAAPAPLRDAAVVRDSGRTTPDAGVPAMPIADAGTDAATDAATLADAHTQADATPRASAMTGGCAIAPGARGPGLTALVMIVALACAIRRR